MIGSATITEGNVTPTKPTPTETQTITPTLTETLTPTPTTTPETSITETRMGIYDYPVSDGTEYKLRYLNLKGATIEIFNADTLERLFVTKEGDLITVFSTSEKIIPLRIVNSDTVIIIRWAKK